ncbi:hypothetical protein BDA99DRAFT_499048 [Phascolomyces articulosus]|uniref:Uncharacterized protein n=1 Tax=Phascolomyces articulosus TaxID=60185 RepID=A0AAD5PH48_9FUNG|nr:hypothetical protein BDA99DRAFT_499048 [Phascolomyces articulosus]
MGSVISTLQSSNKNGTEDDNEQSTHHQGRDRQSGSSTRNNNSRDTQTNHNASLAHQWNENDDAGVMTRSQALNQTIVTRSKGRRANHSKFANTINHSLAEVRQKKRKKETRGRKPGKSSSSITAATITTAAANPVQQHTRKRIRTQNSSTESNTSSNESLNSSDEEYEYSTSDNRQWKISNTNKKNKIRTFNTGRNTNEVIKTRLGLNAAKEGSSRAKAIVIADSESSSSESNNRSDDDDNANVPQRRDTTRSSPQKKQKCIPEEDNQDLNSPAGSETSVDRISRTTSMERQTASESGNNVKTDRVVRSASDNSDSPQQRHTINKGNRSKIEGVKTRSRLFNENIITRSKSKQSNYNVNSQSVSPSPRPSLRSNNYIKSRTTSINSNDSSHDSSSKSRLLHQDTTIEDTPSKSHIKITRRTSKVYRKLKLLSDTENEDDYESDVEEGSFDDDSDAENSAYEDLADEIERNYRTKLRMIREQKGVELDAIRRQFDAEKRISLLEDMVRFGYQYKNRITVF